MNTIRQMTTIRPLRQAFNAGVAGCLSLLTATVLMTAATHAGAADLVILASAAGSSTAPARTSEQELAAIEVISNYTAAARAELTAAARYPGALDAKGLHPEGKVAVLYQLDRQGNLRNAVVQEPSRSRNLNLAALANVRRAQFQAFPASFYPDADSVQFMVTYDFRFDGQK